jgi:stress-induced morphogen
MTTLLDKIKTKINNKIKTEQLLIIDNSNLHKNINHSIVTNSILEL